MTLSLDEAARERLAQAGYDPVYGARPLKRAIQREVEDPLAQWILNGDFAPGGAISVTTSGDGLEFVKGKAAEAA
jgi:ATP-dependent Clp protease ATP-binding subunit ClpB